MTERMTEDAITDIADYITYREQAGSAPHNERDNIPTMARMLTEIRNLNGLLAERRVGELTVTRTDEEGYTIRGLTHLQARGLDLLISYMDKVPLQPEQRNEMHNLLGVMLPVLGGLTDVNTLKGPNDEVR